MPLQTPILFHPYVGLWFLCFLWFMVFVVYGFCGFVVLVYLFIVTDGEPHGETWNAVLRKLLEANCQLLSYLL